MLDFAEKQEISLRPYQEKSVQGLRDGIAGGAKRQVLVAPTGAGKTVIAAHLLKQANDKGSYALFLVDRVSLVDQTSATLDNYGVNHGIVQGINQRYDPYENVQVCSIQTLARRKLPRNPNLIIYDEAHCRYKAIEEYIDANPQAVVIGLTATPFTAGMADRWGGMVNVTTTMQLVKEKFLIEPTIYVAKSPDEKDFERNSYGEFSDSSASSAGILIIGDVVSEWVGKTFEHFGKPAKTIVFSPTVEHGRELCQAFRDKGYNFQQVSYLDKDDDERRKKIEEFRKPDSEIVGLVSCGVLTKGFDVGDVMIGVSCKPYRKSLSAHLQEIGRIMRTHPEKEKALWLCHSGNVERFAIDQYDVWENGAGELSSSTKRDSEPRERTEQKKEAVVCPECSGTMNNGTCRSCGWERPARSGINAIEGELQEFDIKKSGGMEPRAGLRAECLAEPKIVWRAALNYCVGSTKKGEQAGRKWAYGVFRGIYPNSKFPAGWFDAPVPPAADANAIALVEREIKRFRKKPRRAA